MASVTGKKIVEEVSGWLRVYDDGTVDRSWTGPLELKFFVDSVPPRSEFIDGVALNDVVIDPNTNLSVRMYIPQTEHSTISDNDNRIPKLPLVLHFHGGGFCFSQADWYLYYHFYANLVRRARLVLVSVYLPLAPEHKLPSACDTAFAAFKWLGSVARGESRDPWLNDLADFKRVFLIGDSTGGNIVHDVAARAGSIGDQSVKLAGAIALHPGFQRAKLWRSFNEKTEMPFLTRDMINRFMDLAVPVASEASKDHPIINPMGPHAPPLVGLNFPPVMVAVAEEDLLIDTELEYCEAMKEAGKEVEIVVSQGMGHCFYLNKVAMESDPKTVLEGEKFLQAIIGFINKH
ncbi:hypothetical protein VNO77_15114 [Canavalia gladiata]|uniref:Alpha/beta hydrolase fold-3 domain-containing protein n=1 Tax=Canavalia gladiata TaxID=3824 RepID=A0AAN9QR28_CANGL